MANVCVYKMIVKGKKNACYALFGSMPCLDSKDIERESGTDDNYEMMFRGDCKWAVDYSCNDYDFTNEPLTLPNDAQEAYDLAEGSLWYIVLEDKAKLFNVDILCNEMDIEYPSPELYRHIQPNGIMDFPENVPEELEIASEYGWSNEEILNMYMEEDEEE